jgi:RNase P/RNase MRP subunit p29
VNVIGEEVEVTSASDPTKVGKAGTALLETYNMLIIQAGGRKVSVEKRGSTFRLRSTGEMVDGSSLVGRLEDRWGSRR